MKKYLLLIFVIILTLGLYGHYYEAQHLTVNSVRIQNNSFRGVLKDRSILFLSDLHFGNNYDHFSEDIILIVKQLKPALICLGGDYVEWFATEKAYRQAVKFLSQLQAPLGVFAVMGDADYTFSRFSCLFCHAEGTAKRPKNHSVRFLKNEIISLPITDGKSLVIAGLNTEKDLSFNDKFTNSLSGKDPVILLSHSSQIYNKLADNLNILVLSGDTHGGQIYLPLWLWRVLKRKPDPQHMYGYFHEGHKHLYVSDGVGTTDLDLRLGVPPQITVLSFEAEGK